MSSAQVVIGGGCLGALLMIGFGLILVLRRAWMVQAKVRALGAGSVFRQAASISMLAAAMRVRADELEALVARAVVARERIVVGFEKMRAVVSLARHANPAQNPDS